MSQGRWRGDKALPTTPTQGCVFPQLEPLISWKHTIFQYFQRKQKKQILSSKGNVRPIVIMRDTSVLFQGCKQRVFFSFQVSFCPVKRAMCLRTLGEIPRPVSRFSRVTAVARISDYFFLRVAHFSTFMLEKKVDQNRAPISLS